VVTWEVVVTFAYDLRILTGRRRWRWLMMLYFICRICLILQVWALAIYSNAITDVNCLALAWMSKLGMSIGMCASSTILGLRAYSVWERNNKVGCIILVLLLGQLGLRCYLDTYWGSYWDPSSMLCFSSALPAKGRIYIGTYSYAMGFDIIVLLLMLKKLLRRTKTDGFRALLLKDGILYFIASILANGTAAIVIALHYNAVTTHVTMSLSSLVSIVAACRLLQHTSEFHFLACGKPTSSVVSPIAFRSGGSTNGDLSQVFALADMRGTVHDIGAESVAGNKGKSQIDVEQFADSQYDKNIPRGIQHVLAQSDLHDMDPPKVSPL